MSFDMLDKLSLDKKLLIKVISMLVILIYITFLYIDAITKNLGNEYSVYLKYSIIVLCLILTLFIGSRGYNKRDKVLLQLARFFTLIADYYLLIHNNFPIGVFFFCLVQITYIIRHSFMQQKSYKNFVFLAIALGVSIVVLLKIKSEFIERDLVMLPLVYASILLTSVYAALSTLTRGKYTKNGTILISIGMVLFLLCDLNVALHNVIGKSSLNHIVSPKVKFLTGYLIWVFYAPSQILLSWSGFKDLK
jgi:hypothetical protein